MQKISISRCRIAKLVIIWRAKEVYEMTIGKRIKERRLSLGMTVDELAMKLGKNRATVYRYESDEIKDMPLSVLVPLADALYTTPTYLIGIEVEENDREELQAVQLKKIIDYFCKLNASGQTEALNRLQEMTSLEKYTKK